MRLRENNVRKYCGIFGKEYDAMSDIEKQEWSRRYDSYLESLDEPGDSTEEPRSSVFDEVPEIFKENGYPDLDRDFKDRSECIEMIKNGESMLLYGPNGVGKSHLAWAVKLYFVKIGKSVLLDECYHIKSFINRNNMDADEIEEYYADRFDMLIVDEFEKVSMTDAFYQTFSFIINKRYEKKKQTILLGNGDFETVKEMLGQSILSRFTSKQWGASIMEFSGRDRRGA